MAEISIIVVGAGIVGLATAFHLRRSGAVVTVVDRDPEGDKASLGNAGGIAVTEVSPIATPGLAWRLPGLMLDPLGPLAVRPRHAPRLLPWLVRFAKAARPAEARRIAAALSALNARTYDDLLPMLAEAGLSSDLHRVGALTVYESEQGFSRDAADWDLKRSFGIEAKPMMGEAARGLEPALGPTIRRAVFTPQWSHIDDPRRLVEGLRHWLRRNGAAIVAGTVGRVLAPDGDQARLELGGGEPLRADRIVVAAGAWSGLLARRLGDPVLIESERGYNTTITDPGITLGREVIFAERKFVATPLSCGLRVGGSAEFGGLDADPDHRRSRALATLAARYLPGLRTVNGTSWAGHRPATPDSLPVIGPSPTHPRVVYAFGHGHLGLTQAATTGRIVADLIGGRPLPIDLAPYSIARFR